MIFGKKTFWRKKPKKHVQCVLMKNEKMHTRPFEIHYPAHQHSTSSTRQQHSTAPAAPASASKRSQTRAPERTRHRARAPAHTRLRTRPHAHTRARHTRASAPARTTQHNNTTQQHNNTTQQHNTTTQHNNTTQQHSTAQQHNTTQQRSTTTQHNNTHTQHTHAHRDTPEAPLKASKTYLSETSIQRPQRPSKKLKKAPKQVIISFHSFQLLNPLSSPTTKR